MSNVIISRSGGAGSTISTDNIEGILPISKGGTGNSTGLAASATILATSRTVQVNLSSTSSASFNGSAGITPGVTGTLAIANGGTGNTTGLAASATILATTRTIRTNLSLTTAASFNGSANITPGIIGTLPIAYGGTGNTTGLAASATILATARTIRTNLASTSTASFNGSAAVTPGVTGTLAVSNGGTGATTHTSGNFLKGAGTSAITSVTATVARASLSFGYGACSTAAATAAKTVAITNFALISGASIYVKFTYANTNTTTTLNINSTGAKQMYFNGSRLDGSTIKASDIVEFVYDGTYWQIISINSATAASATLSVGTIVLSTTTVTSTSYLACDGAIYSASDYSELAAVLGSSLPSTPSSDGFGVVFNSMVYNGSSKYLAYRYNYSDGGTFTYSSTDGINWTYLSNIYGKYFYTYSMAYGLSRYIIIFYQTNSGYAYPVYSTDGTTWTAMTGHSTVRLTSVCFGNDRFVAVGYSDYSYYSTDGTTWTAMTGFDSNNTYVSLVTYGNGRFVATCTYTAFDAYYSTDGTTWTAMTGLKGIKNGTTSYYATLTSLIYFNDRFLVYDLSNNNLYQSTNGTSWTMSSFSWNGTLYNVGCKLIVVGDMLIILDTSSGQAFYTYDCVTFTEMGNDAELFAHAWVENNGTVYISNYDDGEIYVYTEGDFTTPVVDESGYNAYILAE